MILTNASSRIVRIPVQHLVEVDQAPSTIEFVILELDTNEGIQGIGYTFYGGILNRALKETIDVMASQIIGNDPMPIEAVMDKLHRTTGAGPAGMVTLALSAIDIALWDIKGKALEQPLCVLLGGYRNRVPAYASGTLMRQYPVEYLAKASIKLIDMGFHQIKTFLGTEPTAAREVERIRGIRDAVGYDVDLMCDIGQYWDVGQAIQIGRLLEEYQLFWLEDVVMHDDYQGMARVAEALSMPICAGELVYGITPFRQLLEARSIDIVMVDLFRVGGITPWMKVAALAAAFNIPVVSHLAPEIHVHLVAAVPNGLTIEYMPWSLGLFEETPTLEDGQIVVPQKPGLGLAFKKDLEVVG